jgi:hypothetical protein
MAGTAFVIRDAAARPRSGQNVVLLRHEQVIKGTVRSFFGDCVSIYPESSFFVRQLRPGARLTAHVMTGEGTLESTVAMLGVHDGFVTLQVIGLPRLLQRRGHPRIAVRVPVNLTWLGQDGTVLQAVGCTQNLSMGGALVRFPTVPAHLPTEATAVLLELGLPGRSVSGPVRILQVWDTGTRVRFLDLHRSDRDALCAFIEPRLR